MDYYGYTDYGYYDYDAAAGVLGGFIIIFLIIGLIALAVGIIQTIAFWKIFKKAGKGGWEAIIPFYGNWVLMEIAGLNWWWFLLLFAPLLFSVFGLAWIGYLANIFALFNCYYNLAKKFNKGTGFAVCLTIFTPICAPILGFSKNNVYDAGVVVSNNGLFGPSGNANNGNNNVNNNGYNNMNNNNNVNNYQNNTYQQPTYNNSVNNNIPQEMPVQNDINNAGNVNTAPAQEYVFCGNCGTKLNKDAKFCPNCGKQNM